MSNRYASLVLVGGLAVATGLAAYSQQRESTTQPQAAQQVPPPPSTMSMPAVTCQDLTTRHQQFMTDLGNMDQTLDQLVQQMRDAKPDRAKIDATATVVEQIVTQRKQIRERETALHHDMMAYMLGRMSQSGGTMPMDCPFMTQMMSTDMMQGPMPMTTPPGGPDDATLNNPNAPRQ